VCSFRRTRSHTLCGGRRQAYQEALTYQPPTSPRYRNNMAMSLIGLGLAHQRRHRFEPARVAYTRALHHLVRLPPGPDRDLGLNRVDAYVKEVTGRSARDPHPVAETTRAARQTPEQRLALWGDALEETREAVLAVRTTRPSAKAAGPGPGPESGGAKASKASKRRQRRKQRKHQPQPMARLQDGRADADGEEAAGGAAEHTQELIPAAPPAQEREGEAKDCAICCEELDAGDDEEEPAAMLPCAHSFHAFCIEMWLATCARKGLKKTCPNCRVECPSYVP
jgi:hypothetical protein